MQTRMISSSHTPCKCINRVHLSLSHCLYPQTCMSRSHIPSHTSRPIPTHEPVCPGHTLLHCLYTPTNLYVQVTHYCTAYTHPQTCTCTCMSRSHIPSHIPTTHEPVCPGHTFPAIYQPPTNLYVQVALVADEGVGDALVSAEQRQVEGNVALRITLVKLVGQLRARKETAVESLGREKKDTFTNSVCSTLPGFFPHV